MLSGIKVLSNLPVSTTWIHYLIFHSLMPCILPSKGSVYYQFNSIIYWYIDIIDFFILIILKIKSGRIILKIKSGIVNFKFSFYHHAYWKYRGSWVLNWCEESKCITNGLYLELRHLLFWPIMSIKVSLNILKCIDQFPVFHNPSTLLCLLIGVLQMNTLLVSSL